ncbi:hypothetical protein AMTRI_Chr01g135370 [Amborella trichopoda]|uniref:RWP-RK domain-containing protein n=1 Tax=Amborella trichopoda TaxID=13333 RepID=W1PF37_AMBTC|nr:protein NLP6 [Amborella trichopoda]XP_020523225.1 protein NLP6 [Amborella trichopoda]ERN06588.1 hypothetical protein AMTR_s00058p00147810 [Amborella trichopoda]|eukprot:XP_006844913.1 protein NLP6 [Amborella trichopoda]
MDLDLDMDGAWVNESTNEDVASGYAFSPNCQELSFCSLSPSHNIPDFSQFPTQPDKTTETQVTQQFEASSSLPKTMYNPESYSPMWLFSDNSFPLKISENDPQITIPGNIDPESGLKQEKSIDLTNCDGSNGLPGPNHMMGLSEKNQTGGFIVISESNSNEKSDKASNNQNWVVDERSESDGSCVLKARMMQALRYFKESTEQHVLVQVWAPVKNGDKYVLTTSGQPFVLDPHSNGLLQYRTVSLMYVFSTDPEKDSDLGLPGRVFRKKLPEWTPNVQYYSSNEYARLTHAMHYNVRGTLALPVFEPLGQSCVGVVELIMTAQKINYAPEVDKVCKALEAVNLKSSEILDHPNLQICNEGRQAALAEILEIVTVVCETHSLPLAQTWVPCRHRSVLAHGGGSRKSCTSFDGSCMGQVCMSTTDVAFYVVDAHMWGFRDACSEHHLQKGQGVTGRAFESHRPRFSRDITQFSKTEYPLVHYARMFGLAGALAICLRSTHTGSDDYILEFFLPPNCKDTTEQQRLLDSLATTIQGCRRSLRVVSDQELMEENVLEIIEGSMNGGGDMMIEGETGQNCANVHITQESGEPHENDELQLLEQQRPSEVEVHKDDGKLINTEQEHAAAPLSKGKNVKKGLERRRGKAEKTISLEVLKQYFAGSLKDSAKSIGVCPTTLKRICRQHGISRWPSRKINKVNRSLSKLQRVIESVHGAEGAFNLPVALGPIPLSTDLKASKEHSHHSVEKERETPPSKTLEEEHPNSQVEPLIRIESDVHQQLGDVGYTVHESKSKSDVGDEATEAPTSQGSCLSSPTSETQLNNLHTSLIHEIESFDGFRPIVDAGSCKDLSSLCNMGTEDIPEEQLPEPNGVQEPLPLSLEPHPPFQPAIVSPFVQETQADIKSVAVKASYKEDIIRFRLRFTSGVVELNEEVAKRLKLEMGTFDIKYLDDDQEWVLLACDADLQECIDILMASMGHVIRLLVHDVVSNLGSSCESSGE